MATNAHVNANAIVTDVNKAQLWIAVLSVIISSIVSLLVGSYYFGGMVTRLDAVETKTKDNETKLEKQMTDTNQKFDEIKNKMDKLVEKDDFKELRNDFKEFAKRK